jgi:sulfhydrogenase subunit gamma (sulfur reductase)
MAENTQATKAIKSTTSKKATPKAAPKAATKAAPKKSAAKATPKKTSAKAAPKAAAVALKQEAAAPALKPEAASPAVKAAAQSPAVKAASPAPAVQPVVAAASPVEQAEPAAKAERTKPEAAAPAQPQAAKTNKGRNSLKEISARPMRAGNPYLPMPATVIEVIQETGNIKTIRAVLDKPEDKAAFHYEPGQVGQLSVFGAGEATFVINTPPSCTDYIQFSVMLTGEVTGAIHKLSVGDKVGVRAPLGNFFPYEQWKGKNVVFVGGGIGMAPIRTIMLHMLERKQDYGTISLLYGARSPRDMAFSYELEGWMNNPDLNCTLCIDAPFEGWQHKVGLIPNVLTEMNPSPQNCVAVLCGPPIMIKFTVQALEKLGFSPENIITTLEKRMKCGIGICGRCNIGGKYVCVDGPVFSWAELKALPPDM